MGRRLACLTAVALAAVALTSCGGRNEFTGERNEVKLITLDPGHFHAALVQKIMYEQVDPVVHVYAPPGADVEDHLARIEGFNTRAENPTDWETVVYTGEDFLRKMLDEKSGNVVVISGNNRRKTEYIKACADGGLNLLVDKPMCINKAGFQLLLEAFDAADERDVLLYDIMTERYEITTMLQQELMQVEPVFGNLIEGSVETPAFETESVHHFFKMVAGNPIKRPGWYFDTTQQGEGIVDVTTHLVDLSLWEMFPEQPIHWRNDVEVVAAKRWPTMMTREQYKQVTRLDNFIPELRPLVNAEGVLPVYANGEIDYTVKGHHAKVRVLWNYEAPEGAKDTHFAIARGSKATLIIRQGAEQNYRPELFIEPATPADSIALAVALPRAIAELQEKYPGIKLERQGMNWHVAVPDQYHVGHEAHFGQVTEKYLRFLVEGELPEWEVPNMKSKYYITTTGLEKAEDGN